MSRRTNSGIEFSIGKNSIKPRGALGMTQWRIQSVLVPKATFSKSEAIKYIKEHFEYKKIDSTQRPNWWSFRQIDPVKGSKYITKKLDNGVELVIEKPPAENSRSNLSTGGSLPFGVIYKVIKNGYSIAQQDNVDFKDIGDFVLEYSTSEVQVYKSKSRKQIIINYVGTYKFLDWLNALAYYYRFYTTTDRYKRAETEFLKVLNTNPKYKITIVAHSQSAAISRELLKKYKDVFEIINLNPVADPIDEKPLKKEYTVFSGEDIPSFYKRDSPNDLMIKAESFNPITEHSPDILLRLNLETEFGRK
jgi:hypothetical protein